MERPVNWQGGVRHFPFCIFKKILILFSFIVLHHKFLHFTVFTEQYYIHSIWKGMQLPNYMMSSYHLLVRLYYNGGEPHHPVPKPLIYLIWKFNWYLLQLSQFFLCEAWLTVTFIYLFIFYLLIATLKLLSYESEFSNGEQVVLGNSYTHHLWLPEAKADRKINTKVLKDNWIVSLLTTN